MESSDGSPTGDTAKPRPNRGNKKVRKLEAERDAEQPSKPGARPPSRNGCGPQDDSRRSAYPEHH